MSTYLLDTSVLSTLAPDKPRPTDSFREWMLARESALYISIVTVAEVEQGIALLRRTGGAKRIQALTEWLDRTIEVFGHRIELFTPVIARTFGQVSADAMSIGRHPGFADVAIAATAKAGGHTLLTRNIKHFAPLGIDIHDPFAPASP